MMPPLSGPLCEGSCFQYPYTDTISRFPRDYYWMFPAILVSMLFVVLLICIHHYADSSKKIFSHIGIAFGLISSVLLMTDYFVQVSVIQPSLLKGETEGIAMLSQYNPHGVFIAVEEIGYLMMCFALFSVVPVFYRKNRLERAIRITCFLGFILGILSLVFTTATYGVMREYFFEIAIISIAWLTLIVSSILMSILFRNTLRAL